MHVIVLVSKEEREKTLRARRNKRYTERLKMDEERFSTQAAKANVRRTMYNYRAMLKKLHKDITAKEKELTEKVRKISKSLPVIVILLRLCLNPKTSCYLFFISEGKSRRFKL